MSAPRVFDYPSQYFVYCEGCVQGCPSPLGHYDDWYMALDAAKDHVKNPPHRGADALIRMIEETSVRAPTEGDEHGV